MKELIICAAVRIEETKKIYYGHRHHNCIAAMNGELSWTLNRQQILKVKTTQGFVTSLNRFVDRKEALILALENSQVLSNNEIIGKRLYSENLY